MWPFKQKETKPVVKPSFNYDVRIYDVINNGRRVTQTVKDVVRIRRSELQNRPDCSIWIFQHSNDTSSTIIDTETQWVEQILVSTK